MAHRSIFHVFVTVTATIGLSLTSAAEAVDVDSCKATGACDLADDAGLQLLQREAYKRIHKKQLSEDVALHNTTHPLSSNADSDVSMALTQMVDAVGQRVMQKFCWSACPAEGPGNVAFWIFAVVFLCVGAGIIFTREQSKADPLAHYHEPLFELPLLPLIVLCGLIITLSGLVMQCIPHPIKFWGMPILEFGVILLDLEEAPHMHFKYSNIAVMWWLCMLGASIAVIYQFFIQFTGGDPLHTQLGTLVGTLFLMLMGTLMNCELNTRMTWNQKVLWFGLLNLWVWVPGIEVTDYLLNLRGDIGYVHILEISILGLIFGLYLSIKGGIGNKSELEAAFYEQYIKPHLKNQEAEEQSNN